jgi:MEMO1 family protein
LEHSIEAMIPWLQYFNPDVKITPIMVTQMNFERMQELSEKLGIIISGYINSSRLVPGRDIFFLCSSDANHYGKDFDNAPLGEDETAHTKAIEKDRQIADKYLSGPIESGKIKSFSEAIKDLVWCGKYSVPFGLLTSVNTVEKAFGKRLAGSILDYSDSYSEGVMPLRQTGMGITAPFSLKHWVGYLSAGYWIE